jgi:tetratricopeptide (TPR) repeat protein
MMTTPQLVTSPHDGHHHADYAGHGHGNHTHHGGQGHGYNMPSPLLIPSDGDVNADANSASSGSSCGGSKDKAAAVFGMTMLPSPTSIADIAMVDPSINHGDNHGHGHGRSRSRGSMSALQMQMGDLSSSVPLPVLTLEEFKQPSHHQKAQPQAQPQPQPQARRYFQRNNNISTSTPIESNSSSHVSTNTNTSTSNHCKPPTHSRRHISSSSSTSSHRRLQSLPAASALLSVPEFQTATDHGNPNASGTGTVLGTNSDGANPTSNNAGRPPSARRRFFQDPVSESSPPASPEAAATSTSDNTSTSSTSGSGIQPKNRHRRMHSLPMVFEETGFASNENETENEHESKHTHFQKQKENRADNNRITIANNAHAPAPNGGGHGVPVGKLDGIAAFAAAAATPAPAHSHSRRNASSSPSRNHRRLQSLPAASALCSVQESTATDGNGNPSHSNSGNTNANTTPNSAGRPPSARRRFFQDPVSKSAPPAGPQHAAVTATATSTSDTTSTNTPTNLLVLPKSSSSSTSTSGTGIQPKNRHRRMHSLPMVFEESDFAEHDHEYEQLHGHAHHPQHSNHRMAYANANHAPAPSDGGHVHGAVPVGTRKLDDIAAFAAAAVNLEEKTLSPVKLNTDPHNTTASSAGAGAGLPPRAHSHRRYFSTGGTSPPNKHAHAQQAPILVYNAPAEEESESYEVGDPSPFVLNNLPMTSNSHGSSRHIRHASLPVLNQHPQLQVPMQGGRQEQTQPRGHMRHGSSGGGSFGGSISSASSSAMSPGRDVRHGSSGGGSGSSGKQVLMLNSVLANPEALRLNQKLLKMVAKVGDYHFLVASMLNQMGSLLFASPAGGPNHFADAAYFYRKALKVIRYLYTHDTCLDEVSRNPTNCDAQHYELSKLEASTCTNLGTTQWRLQAFQDALANFTRAYEVHQAHAAHHADVHGNGEDSDHSEPDNSASNPSSSAYSALKNTSDAAHNLGCALTFAKDYHGAVLKLEEALRLRIECYGTRHHIEVARTVSLLGTVYGHTQEHKQALMWHMEALQMKQKLLSSTSSASCNSSSSTSIVNVMIHPSILASIKDVAKCHEVLGQNHMALHYYLQLQSELQSAVSSSVVDHGLLWHTIGTLYHKLHHPQQAQASFQEARLFFVKAGLTQNDARVQSLKQSMLALVVVRVATAMKAHAVS